MVVSDMTVPGIPLVYINKGFQTVTGHGKEKIGTSCRFLQGPETEKYRALGVLSARWGRLNAGLLKGFLPFLERYSNEGVQLQPVRREALKQQNQGFHVGIAVAK